MKSNLLLPVLICLIFLAGACEKENKYTREELPVTFISSLTTEQIDPISRVVGSSWSANDKIGVFMMEAPDESVKINILNNAVNIPHITENGDGYFTPAPGEDGIYFPKDKNVDFIAYYPYNPSIEDYQYEILLTNQTSPENIDILYSNNARRQNKDSDKVKLNFTHQLAKLQLDITTEEWDLSDLTVTISGSKTKGIFDLLTGELTTEENSVNDIIAFTTGISSSVTSEAILFPTEDMNNITLLITLPTEGKKFRHPFPANQKFEAGKRYYYKIKLKKKENQQEIRNLVEVKRTYR